MAATRQSSTVILAVKHAVRTRDGHRCTRCGMADAEHRERYGLSLEVHRVTPGSPYTNEACTTLCKPCHGKEPKRPRGQRRIDEPWLGVCLSAEISSDLSAEFKRFLDSLPPDRRPTKRAVLETALVNYLSARGYWPPKG